MAKYLKLFDTHTQYETYINGNDAVRPNVSYCEDVMDVHYNPVVHDYSQDYFTIEALENGAITFTPKNSNVISYSTDNGNTWTAGNSVNVSNGDKVLWKGNMTPLQYEGIGNFTLTCNSNVQGNIMSLLFDDDFQNQLSLEGKNHSFPGLFYGLTKIINAENLSLPATTLAQSCYNCMFMECTNLTTAPTLPATTLAQYCYNNMFNGCTSLTSVPELPATTLTDGCYSGMFQGCTSLNYIKAMFTTTPSNFYTGNWVKNVAASGTFVKNSAAEWDVSGDNGIPNGWTVQTASE